jgi:hypothetical protein
MTDAERQKRRYDRKKAGLVRVEEWVPADAVEAVRAAIANAVKETARRKAFANRPLPDHWRVGDRIRYIRDKEHCCDAGALGVVVHVSPECAEKPAGEYQVFWTRPDGWAKTLGGESKFYTTSDEVELARGE